MLRVFRHYLSAPALLMLCVEAGVLLAVLYAFAAQIEVAVEGAAPGALLPTVVPTTLFAAAVLYSVGMYDRATLADHRRSVGRLLAAFVICWPAMFVPALLLVETLTLPVAATATGLALAGGLGGVFAARVLGSGVVHADRLRRRVLVLGVGPSAARVESLGSARGPLILGYVRFRNEPAAVPDRRVIAGDGSLLETARRLRADEIVVAVDDRRGASPEPLLECRLDGVAVTDLLTFWERETGKVMLEALSPSWLIYSDGFRLGSFVNQALKRVFDIVVGLAVLALTLPVMLLAAVAIRLDSPGPVFYQQERAGLNGRIFRVCKFRSMCSDAEEDGMPRWAAENDPRITRVGAWLRKARIDELPQVWNVLKGDMSFIGPRPERPFFVEAIAREVPYYQERARVRPGITGWAQVNYPYGASIDDAREKLAYDIYYIKNYSLLLDMLVLLATVEVVLWPRGVR